jgi:hypothetical protein
MPFCPVCRCEYVEGIRRCSDCDAILVDTLPPPAKEKETVEESFVPVLTEVRNAEATVVCEILQGAGIPVIGQLLNPRRVYTKEFPALIDLMVPASMLDAAKGLIEEALNAGKEMAAE